MKWSDLCDVYEIKFMKFNKIDLIIPTEKQTILIIRK